MAKENKNYSFALIAVVAIVAIVALVTLVIHGKGTKTEYSATNPALTAPTLIDANLKGEASASGTTSTIYSTAYFLTNHGCVDSDGINFYKKGSLGFTITSTSVSLLADQNNVLTDECFKDGYTLIEYACILGTNTPKIVMYLSLTGEQRIISAASLFSSPRQIIFTCPNGCADGACKPAATCGNGLIEYGEACDGNNLEGQNCVSLGFLSGTLSCSSCQFITSGCVAKTHVIVPK
jgi:hypothetical protein